MNKIRHLSETTINRIAAGEVIERPSSVIKELVENAIDAGATKIEIILEQSGKNLIKIIDNGCGISKDDLPEAIRRHTTSKLMEDDIMNITSFGFRGEALPSIASVSRMEIVSKPNLQDAAYSIKIEGGNVEEVKKASLAEGSKVTIQDLFFATPARLKFLRSDRAELASCIDIVKKMSASYPRIDFTLTHNDKQILKLAPTEDQKSRISDVLGEDFIRNSIEIDIERDGIKISGHTSLPTYNKATSEGQYLYINRRPVKDKVLTSAMRVAYQDYLASGRFAVATIFIEVSPHFVDVNVHPAKTEVRFRDVNLVRGILISSIKDALFRQSGRVADTVSEKAIDSFTPSNFPYADTNQNPTTAIKAGGKRPFSPPSHLTSTEDALIQHNFTQAVMNAPPEVRNRQEEAVREAEKGAELFPLGSAVAQVADTYIISQTPNSIIVTDQHAAHERLTYEKLKKNLTKGEVPTQRLLMPEIVELDCEKRAAALADKAEDLKKCGFVFENFSKKSIVVNEVPQVIGDSNIQKLVSDMADNILEMGEQTALDEIQEHILETYACHHSIRAGRKLSVIEMNGLLREMEATEGSGQCNHGRPTHITLKLKDIEKLFGRS